MRRREFLVGAGATAAAAFGVRAQSTDQLRRVGIIVPGSANDARYQSWIQTFRKALSSVGESGERKIHLEVRFATDSPAEIRKNVTELVAQKPDVIVAHGASTIRPLLQATRSIPIVFPIAADPVGAGFVRSLTRPGGNVTGFMTAEYGSAGKWLELLKETAPKTTRAGVFRDPATISSSSQFAAIQAVSEYVKVEVMPLNLSTASEIDSEVAEFARSSAGGLLITSGPSPQHYRDLIVSLAARHKLPAVYPERFYVEAGGLISYGVDYPDQYRRAATYVDRILRGEKPADLPVQTPNKFELVINLRTAMALGLAIPEALLSTADEVIE